MPAISNLRRFGLDSYFVLLVGTVALAAVFPARATAAAVVSDLSFAGVALLFFLYGARFEPRAILRGLADWRTQSVVAAFTYLAFPLLGVVAALVLGPHVGVDLAAGIVFLAVLPSTVQSSITFTSLAHGNVPAAVCAATVSNLAGIVLTPVLAALLLTSNIGGFGSGTFVNIATQILLPFVIGQFARRWIGAWIEHRRRLILSVDRGVILLIVYSAFSASVVTGLWQAVSVTTLLLVLAVDVVILTLVLFATRAAAEAMKLPRADVTTVQFCGSMKSLASGLPVANIIFAGQAVSLIVLPLMLYHQLQLLVCAALAQRLRARAEASARDCR